MVPESILDNRMGSNINLERQKQLIFAGSDPFAFLTYIKKAILGKIFIPILISIYNHNNLL